MVSLWCKCALGRDRKEASPALGHKSLYIHIFVHVVTRTRYGALLLPRNSGKKRESMRIAYANLPHSPFSFEPPVPPSAADLRPKLQDYLELRRQSATQPSSSCATISKTPYQYASALLDMHGALPALSCYQPGIIMSG